jgi:hypothetical protein
MKKKTIVTAVFLAALTAGNSFADVVNFGFYVDDYATVSIDSILEGSYNNSAAAGNIIFTSNLTPGWHSLSIDYANQAGTNSLSLSQEYPSDSVFSAIPLSDFRSLNQSSQYISGLRADYYSSLGGSYLFTVYGEGPIVNGALSFTSEIYEGNPGLWAGTFGPSSIFEERLSGDIFVGSVPEPSPASFAFIGVICLALLLVRRSRDPNHIRQRAE